MAVQMVRLPQIAASERGRAKNGKAISQSRPLCLHSAEQGYARSRAQHALSSLSTLY